MSSSTDKHKPSEGSPNIVGIFLALLPKIPLIARVALLHILQLSEQSKYLDLRTELTVAVIRSFLMPSQPRSISSTQKLLNRDPGIKGRIWVSKYTAPSPKETSIRDSVFEAIDRLRHPLTPKTDVRLPEIAPVEAEWTGYRAGASSDSRLPSISEEEKYAKMMDECKTPTTVLYFHGGGYYLMDPATHRPTTKKLAKLTGGRCYSVRYRLAPQNPFPAALMDALASYLTLLYPPPGAFHKPVSREHIVFAGDSAGGNLSVALLQLVLQLRRQDTKITWFGEERDLPLPAGVAVNSPWVDITHSSPSCTANVAFDFLPALGAEAETKPRPKCEAWPASPPRKTFYADDTLLPHPLVTLLMAPSWKGSPPVYICTGWELLSDEDKYMAGKLHADGVPVVFEEYEGMPHCFALMLNHLDGSRRCLDGWSGFIRQAVENPASISSSFTTVKAKSLKETAIEPARLSPYTEAQMREMIYKMCGIKTAAEGGAKL